MTDLERGVPIALGPLPGTDAAPFSSPQERSSVVAVAVITDLPVHTSNSSDIAAEQSVMSEVNTDVTPCSYAVRESLSIRAGSTSRPDDSL